jgi:protoporphyrinogen oxidase
MIGMEKAIEWVLARGPAPSTYYQGKFWKLPKELGEMMPPSDAQKVTRLFSDMVHVQNMNDLDKIDTKSWLSKYTNNTLVHSYINTVCGLYFVIPYTEASAGEFVRCTSSLAKDLST